MIVCVINFVYLKLDSNKKTKFFVDLRIETTQKYTRYTIVESCMARKKGILACQKVKTEFTLIHHHIGTYTDANQ